MLTADEERMLADLHAGALPFTQENIDAVLVIVRREVEADPEAYRDSWLSFLHPTALLACPNGHSGEIVDVSDMDDHVRGVNALLCNQCAARWEVPARA